MGLRDNVAPIIKGANMNTCTITGNLGDDPESFFSDGGTQITSFSVAFKSIKDKANWIKITCFNKTALVAEKHLHKGARVGITGILDQDKWETNEGESRSAIKLIANSIEFIKTDGRGFDDTPATDDNDDDMPF